MVISGILLLTLLVGIGFIIRVLKPKHKVQYTREYFSFFALKTLSSMILVGLGAAFSNTLSIKWLGVDFNTSPPSITVLVLWLIAVVIFAAFCLYIYKNWSGQQSKNHYQRQQTQEPALKSFFPDVGLYWKHRVDIANSPLAAHQADANQATLLPKARRAELSWQQQARELIQLSAAYKNYVFQDTEHDHNCYLGQHCYTQEWLVLACWQAYPTKQALNTLTRYIKKIEPNAQATNTRLLVALKTGDYDKKTRSQGYKISYISETILLHQLVDFQNYYHAIQARVRKENSLNNNASLLDIYTEASYCTQKNGTVYPHIEQLLTDWLAEKSYRQLALLGEYGRGKSTTSLVFCQHLIAKMHNDKTDQVARIPILFELRGRSPRTLSEEDLLGIWAAPYGINVQALLKLLYAGRLLLIFEGFDEVDLAGDKEVRLNHFKALWRLCYQHSKILITGRPNFFFDEAEQDLALAVRTPSVERPYCELVYLAPFNLAQIKHSLRHSDAQSREQILALAAQNKNFLDVISRPSVLHQISHIWHSEKLFTNEAGDINAALITAHFIQHSIEHAYARQAEKVQAQAASTVNPPNFMLLNTAERAYFMAGIAVYMWINKLPNQINGDALNTITAQLIAVIPEAVSTQIDALSNETKQPLRQRLDLLHDQSTMLQQIQTDVRSCGLLERDPSKSNHFRFGHKSFMEFLCGQVFAYHFLARQQAFKQKIQALAAQSLFNALKVPIGFKHLNTEMAQSAAEVIGEQIKPLAQEQRKNSSAILLEGLFNRIQGSILKSGLHRTGVYLKKHNDNAKTALKRVMIYEQLSLITFVIVYGITLFIFDVTSLENFLLSLSESLSESLSKSLLLLSLVLLLPLLLLLLLLLLLSELWLSDLDSDLDSDSLLWLLESESLLSLPSPLWLWLSLLSLLSSLLWLKLLPQSMDILYQTLIIIGFLLPIMAILLYGFLVKILLLGIFNSGSG